MVEIFHPQGMGGHAHNTYFHPKWWTIPLLTVETLLIKLRIFHHTMLPYTLSDGAIHHIGGLGVYFHHIIYN